MASTTLPSEIDSTAVPQAVLAVMHTQAPFAFRDGAGMSYTSQSTRSSKFRNRSALANLAC